MLELEIFSDWAKVTSWRDPSTKGRILGTLGYDYDAIGQATQAISYYNQALVIAKEIGDRHGEGADLGNLGLAFKNLGQIEEAISYYQQALTISREIGDRRGEGSDLANLGNAYEKQEQMSRALAHWWRAVEIYREIKAPTAETVQGWIDELQENKGEDEFTRLLSESESIYQELRNGKIS